jgi:hypothetical protein
MLDVHTHIFHPKVAPRILKELEVRYGISPAGSGLAEDLIARLKKRGFSKAVVHTAATAPAQVIPANNWSIEIKKRYPELVPFGTIHPGFDRWERELNRLEKNGIKGLKLHPDFQGYWLNDKRLGPIFEAIGERFFLMIHIGDRLPAHKSPSCPVKLKQVIKDFPRLKIIAAHLGGYLQWDLALEHIVGEDIFLDTSSCIDFIPEDTLKKILARHPKERILFGSDYPLFDPGQELDKLLRLKFLPENDIRMICKNGEIILQGNL